ncbi:unnamed protein product [Ceutorhynchus assimilis]|uniref:Transcriptional adapter n=1 Tax=Ceutorhynchus assimilis TaxID=467358 RepID=A0A9N9QDC0_9CUCU|nr:unnamed protein product [Ceutorhynchus assimilis]
MADLSKVSCTYCQEDINTVPIQCCECPNFYICIQCFVVGAEIGPHKNDHSYKFKDNCSVRIFGGRGAWTGREHLQLLDAAELYSFTNWEGIAQQLENRTAEECREEFTARYLDGNIGKAMWSKISKPNIIIDLVEDDGPLSQDAISKLAPLDATLEEAKILGYKPHRDDFEREYNPEAEQLIADIPEEDNDYKVDKALRLAIVDMYTRRLRERQRRKRIVRDYQLVAKYFDNLRRDPSQPLFGKEQKELRDNMRIFAQFLNAGEHERFIASIERERELRHRLSELLRYRSLGMTTQEEIVHYEQHVAYQKQQIRHGKTGSSGFAMGIQGLNQSLSSENGNVEAVSSFIDGRTTWPSESDSGCDNGAALPGRAEEFLIDPVAVAPITPSWTMTVTQTVSSQMRSSSANPSWLNLRLLPFGKWLSKQEIQLCEHFQIQPSTYVHMKTFLIEDNLLTPGKYQHIFKREVDECTGVKDVVTKFLGINGLLPGVSAK